MSFIRSVLTVSLVIANTSWLDAQEKIALRFVEQPNVAGNIVYLGDLVEIASGQSSAISKLMKIPLGPSPAENSVQKWDSEQVLRQLELRGIHLESLRWSGNTSAELRRSDTRQQLSQQSMAPAFLQERTVTQAEDLVSLAIAEYVTFRSGENVDWNIQVQIPVQYVPKLQSRRNIVSIGGGQEPWEGEQEFVIQVRDGKINTNVKVKASLAMPPMVVSAARPLRRDEVLTVEALKLAPVPKNRFQQDTNYFSSFDQLIGKQMRRAVSTGLPIPSEFVGDPILISRNSLVQLESVAGSIVVSTQARSMGSGAAGDLIEVETISTRQRLHATVVNAQTVRIAAQPTRSTR